VCRIDQRLGRKHSLVAHSVIKIISQFTAQTLSDPVGSPGRRFRPGSISAAKVYIVHCSTYTVHIALANPVCRTVYTLLCPRPLGLSDDAVWRLSVTYIGPKSRTEMPRKTKIGTEVAHVTRDSDTTFKVKRSRLQAALVGCTGRLTWTSS